ncbi:hypothetical protein HPB51_021012 [Rhipicephalus microplus]|uniref:THAP-type domain-containing protein n=1 Tax=Rhipicephalus microplus TaxID=6941 RepID=A0A9J6DCH6_RHIMP|nr:hypothetical protein HPB51_021012 [Rhipicephalus microplus]
MAYSCVPKCKSDAKRKVPGISFHEIFSDSEARTAWLKAIARKDWMPNTTSRYSVVCSRHFLLTDYKEGCKTRKLKRSATPSVFDDYPEYMQPKPKKPRSDPSARKRALAPDNAAAWPLETGTATGLFVGADEDTVPADGLTSSFSSPGLAKVPCFTVPLQVEVDAPSEPTSKHEATQVDVRSSISVLERQIFRRKERDLKTQIQRLRQTIDKYKEELKQLKEDCNLTAFAKVVEAAREKHVGACILVDQVNDFAKIRPTYSEVTIRNYIVLRNLSTKAYEFIRRENLLKLPSRATLQRFLGVTTGEVGFTSLVKERLKAELENLSPQQAKVCSLVVDEMRIRQRLQYNKQRDAFVGDVDFGKDCGTPTKGEPVLANSLLCFILSGLSVRIRIPVGYFFTKNCTGQQLFMLMKYVLKGVETAGFIVMRIVTDNHKINVLALEMLCSGKLQHSIKHPEDPYRKLFIAFDQCHLIKNIRSQFLARDTKKKTVKLHPLM